MGTVDAVSVMVATVSSMEGSENMKGNVLEDFFLRSGLSALIEVGRANL